jgi:hypothetical protein
MGGGEIFWLLSGVTAGASAVARLATSWDPDCCSCQHFDLSVCSSTRSLSSRLLLAACEPQLRIAFLNVCLLNSQVAVGLTEYI